MSARELRCRRLRRERALDRERAYREWVCGGPLVDMAQPVIGGGDAEHWQRVREEIERRRAIMGRELVLLAVDFANRCWVVLAERDAMVAWYMAEQDLRGAPSSMPTHSTDPYAPTPPIPAL